MKIIPSFLRRIKLCTRNKNCCCTCKCCCKCECDKKQQVVTGVGVGDGFFVRHKDRDNRNYSGHIWLCTGIDSNVIIGQCLTPSCSSLKSTPFILSDYDIFNVSHSVTEILKKNLCD